MAISYMYYNNCNLLHYFFHYFLMVLIHLFIHINTNIRRSITFLVSKWTRSGQFENFSDSVYCRLKQLNQVTRATKYQLMMIESAHQVGFF